MVLNDEDKQLLCSLIRLGAEAGFKEEKRRGGGGGGVRRGGKSWKIRRIDF